MLPASFCLPPGKGDAKRQKAYAEYVQEAVPESEIKLVPEAMQRGQLTGGACFCAEIERRSGIRISSKQQGRPGRG